LVAVVYLLNYALVFGVIALLSYLIATALT
jgi:hypothetical protein